MSRCRTASVFSIRTAFRRFYRSQPIKIPKSFFYYIIKVLSAMQGLEWEFYGSKNLSLKKLFRALGDLMAYV
jgi:hypothetical protein